MTGNELLDVCTRQEGYDMQSSLANARTVVEFVDINELRNVIDQLPFILESINPMLYNRCMVIMDVVKGIMDIGGSMISELFDELFQVTINYKNEIHTSLKFLPSAILNNDSYQRAYNRALLTGML